MEVDDDLNHFTPSPIIELIKRVKKMTAKPEVDNNLGETLDTFIDQLNDTQEYLSNGIFNVRFAEAALFLQSSVEMYGKKVDILWDNTLQYQMQLCSYKQTEESMNEMQKLAERMVRKGKRKKLMHRELNNRNMMETLNEVIKENYTFRLSLEPEPVDPKPVDPKSVKPEHVDWYLLWNNARNKKYIFSDNDAYFRKKRKPTIAELLWALDLEMKEDEEESIAHFGTWTDKTRFPCDFEVLLKRGDEKLGDYDHILTNKASLSVDLFHNGTPINDDSDFTLQDDGLRSLCLNTPAVVNITRLPQHLMERLQNPNYTLVQELIHQLVANSDTPCALETFIKTLIQEEAVNDTDDHGYDSEPRSQLCCDGHSLRRSNDDSGIVGSQLSTKINERDIIPEENENVNDESAIAERSQTLKLPVYFNSGFVPLITSTPYVKIERLSRKRLLLLNSKLKQPKVKRAIRFKWLKTFSTTEKKFEKFHNQNYIADAEEGVIVPWSDDSSDQSVNNDDVLPEMEVEPTDDNNVNENFVRDFCKDLLLGIVDNIPEIEVGMEINSSIQGNCSTENLSENVQANTQVETLSQYTEPPISLTLQKVYAMFDWREFITPILERAENYPKFDIHEYGTQIMNSIPEDGNLRFKDIATGKEPAEIARLFMAILQLANTGNVELVNTVPGKVASEVLEAKLLTRERYHEHLDEYEAPSEHSIRSKLANLHTKNKINILENRIISVPGPSLMVLLQPFHSKNKTQIIKAKRRRIE